jgi:hypothetical protein
MRLTKCTIAALLALTIFFSPGLVFAGQQYNAFENRWETAPERYDLKYNAFDNQWSYQAPESDLEYNAFENRWEWNPEPSVIQPYPCEVEYDLYHHRENF